MAVETVVRSVELPAEEPLVMGRIPFQHLVPTLEPIEPLRLLLPPAVRVALRIGIDGDVAGVRLVDEGFRGFEEAPFLEERFDRLLDVLINHLRPPCARYCP